MTLACLQDLSQARGRWGSAAADGFFSTSGSVPTMSTGAPPASLEGPSRQIRSKFSGRALARPRTLHTVACRYGPAAPAPPAPSLPSATQMTPAILILRGAQQGCACPPRRETCSTRVRPREQYGRRSCVCGASEIGVGRSANNRQALDLPRAIQCPAAHA